MMEVYDKEEDTEDLFATLKIHQEENYERFQNKYTVIHIMLNDVPKKCSSYEKYIDRIEKMLVNDLKKEYPDFSIDEDMALWDILLAIHAENTTERFIFVLDEWDFIFHQSFVTEEDKQEYLQFLRSLLKDRPYISLVYMTGILPIAKYSSGSELNMFAEYTMTNEQRFSEYFGFTDPEVDQLYERYQENYERQGRIVREDLKIWYDGYYTKNGTKLYNPRSIVLALRNNNTGNYWTSSGPYDEIFYYVENNVNEVRDDIALMIAGIPVQTKIQEYAATSMNLQTKDEIFSAMVVYGFLTYNEGKVMIPNKELMEQFADMLRKESSLRFKGKIGERTGYTGRILAVGIAYDRNTKKHTCKVEVLGLQE